MCVLYSLILPFCNTLHRQRFFACLIFDRCSQHQYQVTIGFVWRLWDIMKDSVWSIGINTRFIAIVNHYLRVHSHVPLCYIDKLNSDVFLCIFVLCGFWISGKYCIRKQGNRWGFSVLWKFHPCHYWEAFRGMCQVLLICIYWMCTQYIVCWNWMYWIVQGWCYAKV